MRILPLRLKARTAFWLFLLYAIGNALALLNFWVASSDMGQDALNIALPAISMSAGKFMVALVGLWAVFSRRPLATPLAMVGIILLITSYIGGWQEAALQAQSRGEGWVVLTHCLRIIVTGWMLSALVEVWLNRPEAQKA